MAKEKDWYRLNGVVHEFDLKGPIVKDIRNETTKAVSPDQAKNNIVSRTKDLLGKTQNTKYVFEGTCTKVGP